MMNNHARACRPDWFWKVTRMLGSSSVPLRAPSSIAVRNRRVVAAPLHIAAISTGAALAVVLWVPPGPSAPRIATLLLAIAALQVPATEALLASRIWHSVNMTSHPGSVSGPQ